MSAPLLRVTDVAAFERPFRLRMPFRFGVITLTHGLQALVRVRIRTEDGREAAGFAAEALAAKWFDKNLALTDEQNQHQLRRSLEIAAEAYRTAPPRTAFGHFAGHHREQVEACAELGLNALIAGYGPALLDRAVLDALCRAEGVSFFAAIGANLPGIVPDVVAPDLAGFDARAFLRGLRPSPTIHARHTVGLLDPITRSDETERVEDGLPETLEEVVAFYGNRYFKLKVGGDRAADLDRLRSIASVLDRIAEPWFATLDGNEQYGDAEGIAALWRDMEDEASLARLRHATLFVEQPIRRDIAVSASVDALARYRPAIIDESDDDVDAFPRARALGYAGVSSKTCKGLYKSILNAMRCRLWNGSGPERYFLSAEDLTTEPGVSVQQDLALVSLLGIGHVERNAHHFIDGFGADLGPTAERYLAAHPDLYHRQDGRIRLRITQGRLAMSSLDCPGYASTVTPDLAAICSMPKSRWPT